MKKPKRLKQQERYPEAPKSTWGCRTGIFSGRIDVHDLVVIGWEFVTVIVEILIGWVEMG
jgi:hypothetical protein